MGKLLPTIVGGAIGVGLATAGFIGGGPAGALMGWSIGSTVGGLVGSLLDKPHIPKSSLGDLRFSGSSYGSVLPMAWGKTLQAGNVTWVANYKNNKTLVSSASALTDSSITHLRYKTKKSGGGGCLGGGSAGSTKTFYASYQVTFGLSSVMYANGIIVTRTPTIRRIWADDILIYDVDNPSSNKITIRFNYGGETNSPDTLIVAAEKPGHPELVDSGRGKISIVIENHDLTPHGGRIPTALKAEIWTNTVSLGDIISDICGPVGIYGSFLDVSACTQGVLGYNLTNEFTAQAGLDGLIKYFYTDCVEADGKLRFVPRGGSIVATIDVSEIGAGMTGETSSSGLTRKKGSRSEVPGKIDVLYYDVDKKFQQLTQSDVKQTAYFRNDTSVSLPFTLTATQARQIAAFLLDSAFNETTSFNFTLSWAWAWLIPTDCVNIVDNGLTYRLRITSIDRTEGGVLSFEALIDDPSATTQVITGDPGSGGGGATDNSVHPVTFGLWSNYALTDNEKGLTGFYVWGNWDSSGNGGTVYYSVDNGSTWIEGPYIGTRSAFGTVATAGGLPSGHDYWQTSSTTNSIHVAPFYDQVPLQTAADSEVLNGTNVFLFGNEIVGFANVTDNGSGNYTVSRIRRAMGNTPVTVSGYNAGDSIYELTDGTTFVGINNQYAGTTVQVKVVAANQSLSDVSAQTVTVAQPTPTDADKVLINGIFPYSLTPYVAASGNGRNDTDWTTVDLSSKILPKTRFASLFFQASDKGNASLTTAVYFRKASGSPEYQVFAGRIITDVDELDANFMYLLELSATGTFDYKITGGFGGQGWSINLHGGFCPLQ